MLDPEHVRTSYFVVSLLTNFRGTRRRQILSPPQLRRRTPDVPRRSWGAHNHSAGPMDRDPGPLRELLGALFTASLAQIFFQDVFVLLSDPLGVDFELPN